MAGLREVLNRQLLDIIHCMQEQGLVDHRLALAHSLKAVSGPLFFVTLLSRFCRDSTEALRDLSVALDQAVLNYDQMEELCFKMKGAASSIGGARMANACSELQRIFQNRSPKERCIIAFNATKHEFLLLQEKMDILVELERRIVSH